jgi:hypothetical protein
MHIADNITLDICKHLRSFVSSLEYLRLTFHKYVVYHRLLDPIKIKMIFNSL